MRDSFNTPNNPLQPHGAITDDDPFPEDDNASDTSSILNDAPIDSQDSPLQLALDDLESRIVSSFNEFKSHPGRLSSPSYKNIHDELSAVLTPIIETSSHVATMNGRTIVSSFPEVYDLEVVMDTIYTKINSELVLPVLLESAQSEMNPPKRAASLRMFHLLFVEWNKSGSWLDTNSSSGGNSAAMISLRKAELLKRWIQACIPNLMQTFTSEALDAGAAGRGVLSASAAIKPCLRYMAERIAEADDAGALRLFLPVMRMIEKVLGRLFLESLDYGGSDAGNKENDALRSSCIKFLEIVVLCFSNKALPGMMAGSALASRMKKDAAVSGCFMHV
jgi:hypothetical protein